MTRRLQTAYRASVLWGLCSFLLTPVVQAESPRYNYVTHCMGCHGPHGEGVAGKIPALNQSLPAFARTVEGRAFAVSVPGASNSNLSDADLTDVMNWLLTQLNADHQSRGLGVFTVAEVSGSRKPVLSKVREARAALLKSLAQSGPVPPDEY